MVGLEHRVLVEDDWARYRDLRTAAQQESPEVVDDGSVPGQEQSEDWWRQELCRGSRLLLLADGEPAGLATVARSDREPAGMEVSELWVAPRVRGSGAAYRLVEAAASLAAAGGATQLHYWVGADNARAIGFALNAGFRLTTYRRTGGAAERPELALVLSLGSDALSVPDASR